jgi:DHA3 family tetracycline resistance protein-like MFS transporter
VRTERRESLVRALVVGTGLRIGASLLFVLAPTFWVALAGSWGRAVFSSITGPWERAWLAESIDPKVRATVLSMTSQVNALGQIAVGPGIGATGSGYGVRAALGVATALMVPTLPLYLRAGRQEAAHSGEVEEAVAPVPVEG